MPHSSGGGHHGGGHHSGGHHSSGGSSRHISTRPYAGARRYMYYHKNRPCYIYSDRDITKNTGSKARLLFLPIYIVFFIVVITQMGSIFVLPKKLDDHCDFNTIIEDNIGVIENPDVVKNVLDDFYETTGISVSLITITNDAWQQNSYSLEDYAFQLYNYIYNGDENHWLIVYSQYQMLSEYRSSWYFEGMQGDNTDAVLNSKVTEAFNSRLYGALTDYREATIDRAIIDAFDSVEPKLMKFHVDKSMLFTVLFVTVFLCFHCYMMVFFDPDKKYRNAVPCPETAPERYCPYCNSMYLDGMTSCANCGARLDNYYI